jgi:hypothetical protein
LKKLQLFKEKRKERDSNPRSTFRQTTVFETAPFNRSGIFPVKMFFSPYLPGYSGFKRMMAEREGFEPPDLLQSTVFKTAAIDHSATSPAQK